MDTKEVRQEILSFDVPAELAKGVYSNLVLMAHSSSEFVLDFALMMPNQKKPAVVSRIILSPEHAKKLLLALKGNVRKYEEMYGEIKFPHWEEGGKTAKPFKINPQGDA